LAQGLELGQAQGVVAVGLALGVLELPRLAGGVGDPARQPELFAEVGHPTGQAASLADDDGRSVLGEQLAEVVAVGGHRLEAGGGRVAAVGAGDGLVFAQVEGENEAGGRGVRFRVARHLPARSHIRMASFPTVDESFARPHRAGWLVGDVRILTAEGPRWLVNGSNGENQDRATGRTQAEAWQRACQQAEAAGMLGRGPRSCHCPGRGRE
jgi:hypothetical protein